MIQSFTFWLVLLGTFLFYWALPRGYRLGFLALASFGYLLTLDAISVCVLAVWAVLFHLAAGPRSGWTWMTLLLAGILSYFAYYKYLPRLGALLLGDQVHPLVLPLGISFFTFKLVHYGVEIARGNIQDRSLARFMAYIFLFPTFTAGPIERYEHFLQNLEDRFNPQSALEGFTRIAHGLIKRFVFAPYLYPQPDIFTLTQNLGEVSSWQLWGYLISSYLWLYLDFSAYTDIAIGASRLFGITIMENFNFPVLATSISDYWQRWHMTLAGWCRSYVYLPMIGLTRNPYLAVYATFLVMGIWHDGTLTRIGWAAYHGTGISVHLTWSRLARRRKWKLDFPLRRALGTVLTFLFVAGGFSFSLLDGSWQLGVLDSLKILAKLVFLTSS